MGVDERGLPRATGAVAGPNKMRKAAAGRENPVRLRWCHYCLKWAGPLHHRVRSDRCLQNKSLSESVWLTTGLSLSNQLRTS